MNFYDHNSLELLAILAFGFFGSLGHCIGMCGGFIVSYTTAKMDSSTSKVSQASGHAFYNLGRISSYTLLGALFGFFGSLWEATPMMRMIMFGFSGLLMVLMGLSLSGRLKFIAYLEYPITQKKWFKKLFFLSTKLKIKTKLLYPRRLEWFFPLRISLYDAYYSDCDKVCSAWSGGYVTFRNLDNPNPFFTWFFGWIYLSKPF